MSRQTDNLSIPGTRPDLESAEHLHTLADAVADVAPPDGLFSRIEAELDAQKQMPVGISSILASEGEWEKRPNGVWKKVLSTRPDGVSMYLLRCEPGAIIPAHHHKSAEQAFVIEGAFSMGGLLFNSGDAQFAAANTDHPEIRSPDGCLLLIVA